MNDFTKLELMHIGDSLFYSMAIFPSRKDSLMTIRGKILEMIDSYCDHELAIVLSPTEGKLLKCLNCDKVFS